MKVTDTPRATTNPSPRASPGLYALPSTGLDVNAALLLATVRYSFAAGLAAVKLPAIEVVVIVPNAIAVG